MPRPHRTIYEGAVYHVTMRGNRKEIVYFTTLDWLLFETLLRRAIVRFEWQVIAYCMLENHFHLVLRTPQPNIHEGMCWLNSMYARRFNRRHGLKGHLFERRYYSDVIEDDDQLREVVRYVLLNPVRASLCARPDQWRWSSCRASLGFERPRFPLDLETLKDVYGSVQVLEQFLKEGMTTRPAPVPWA